MQKIYVDKKTFVEIADVEETLRECSECQRTDMVFGVYRKVTINQTKRNKKAEETATHYKSIVPGHRVQQWCFFFI